ncbi:solute carrier family 45 member 4-like [Arapaima gigas]
MAAQSEDWDKVSGTIEEGDRESPMQHAPLPMSRCLMHGAIMLGQEFSYAMETALVTLVLLQIVNQICQS